MFIHLKNFKNVKDKSFNFEGLTLLKGESGKGKTTILQGIEWCLYGGKGCYPLNFDGTEKEFTSVEMICKEIKIKRTKPPELVKIWKDEMWWEGEEAQGVIDQIFGDRNFWVSSSYLRQGERNPLVSSSGLEKLELVKSITFRGASGEMQPDYFLEKLESRISQLRTEIDRLQGGEDLLHLEMTGLQDQLEDKIDDLRNFERVWKRREEIYKLDDWLRKQEEINLKWDCYKVDLERIEKELLGYPKLTLEKLDDWKKYEEMKSQLESLPDAFNFNDSEEGDLEEKINWMILLEKKWKEGVKICSSLHLEYDEKLIRREITKGERLGEMIVKYNNYLEIKRNFDRVKESLNTVGDELELHGKREKIFQIHIKNLVEITGLEINGTPVEKLRSIQGRIELMRLGVMECPHCEKKVFLEGDRLSKMLKQDLDLERQFSILISCQDYYCKMENMERKKSEIQKVLDKMEEPEVIPEVSGDLDKISKKIGELMKVEVVPYSKIKLDIWKKTLFDIRSTRKLLKIKDEIEKYRHKDFEKFGKPKDFNDYFRKYSKLVEEKERIEEWLGENRRVRDGLIKNKKESCESLKKGIEKYKKFIQWEESHKKWIERKKEKRSSVSEMEKCKKLIKIVEEERNNSIENLMSDFNTLFGIISSEIFPELQLEIQMFKKLKGSGKVKAQFNMKIHVGGNQYDNFSYLSGGEKDRVSIALTLALSNMTKSPVVIFDESMASLSEEMRETCLETMRKYTDGKTVINVCHSTVEGYYDKIIDV